MFPQGWDTDFTVGGSTFQLHNTHLGNPCVYLKVITGVPEPGSGMLAVFGMLGLLGSARFRGRQRNSEEDGAAGRAP